MPPQESTNTTSWLPTRYQAEHQQLPRYRVCHWYNG